MPRSEPNKIKLNDLTLKNLKPRGRPIWFGTSGSTASVFKSTERKQGVEMHLPVPRCPRWFHLAASMRSFADARKLAGKIMVQVGEGKDLRPTERRCAAAALRRIGKELR